MEDLYGYHQSSAAGIKRPLNHKPAGVSIPETKIPGLLDILGLPLLRIHEKKTGKEINPANTIDATFGY